MVPTTPAVPIGQKSSVMQKIVESGSHLYRAVSACNAEETDRKSKYLKILSTRKFDEIISQNFPAKWFIFDKRWLKNEGHKCGSEKKNIL